ncbi:OmpA family protein [Fulvivirga lutea]|uniref:OmpA family protein n=1 Tax=Fulvivirga lutea TaxID=2810512 RepID=A0A975A047_9BACT|nr:OmpA family protein [Fulvivirga lutea]QSE96416.1 OmpA family protein [Fulvivirga lutea]
MRLFLFINFAFCIALAAQGQDSLIRKSIYFGGGSYYIDEYQGDEIIDFLNSIDDLTKYEIVLFSHTDNIGGKQYNEWLSHMRSEAVKYELIQFGIREEEIDIRAFGQDNPLYSNKSSDGRVMNRRVDIILVPITS